MSIKTENTPSQTTIAAGEIIELQTRFGGMSRGKCWGKFFAGKSRATGDFTWVEKSGDTLYLTGPGYYVVGSNDGFNRKAQAEFCLTSKASASAKARADRESEEHATEEKAGMKAVLSMERTPEQDHRAE